MIWLALVGACSSDDVKDDPRDGGSDAGQCGAAKAALDQFVAQHLSCTADADCSILGSCNPNPDFVPVRADAFQQAEALFEQTCRVGYDGPTYMPVCIDHQCSRQQTGWCGEAHRADGSIDGGRQDGGGDASTDASTTTDASSIMDARAP